MALGKGEFIGRAAAVRDKQQGPRLLLVTLVVDAGAADVGGDEPVRQDGRTVGWVTSGGYGHRVGQSIALAYLPAALAVAGAAFAVEILDELRAPRLVAAPLFDPAGERVRG